MMRSNLFDACEHQLAVLCTRVELRGKLNILNLHLHCEDFYAGLLNRLYSWQLKNTNSYEQNSEGIDLIDSDAKILLQVSATATVQKINSALAKDLSSYSGHGFRFMSISKDASHLRKSTYSNPHNLTFNPVDDIYDVLSLLKIILHMELPQQREIYDFLRAQLSDLGSERIMEESNLTSVINIIAKEGLESVSSTATAVDFNVDDKITFNGLTSAAGVIEDYKVYHHIVDRIYTEFDNNAVNKSKSVLDAFRTTYHKLSSKYSGDELFFQIVEDTISKVRSSANYAHIAIEELQLCVNILAVDAFIRCRIFKEPPGASNATA